MLRTDFSSLSATNKTTNRRPFGDLNDLLMFVRGPKLGRGGRKAPIRNVPTNAWMSGVFGDVLVRFSQENRLGIFCT